MTRPIKTSFAILETTRIADKSDLHSGFQWHLAISEYLAQAVLAVGYFKCTSFWASHLEVLRHQQFLKPWALNLWHQMTRKQQYVVSNVITNQCNLLKR